MVSSDPIADMLSRIRNAIMVNKNTVNLPHSKLKERIATILKEDGFLADVKTEKAGDFKRLLITIHEEGQNAAISEIQRISKPGRRQYAKAEEIPVILNGRGTVIVSTSKGLMNGDSARAKKVGGELICKVY
ncbi:MAG: 30S ribosomal protein S8 [Candidatus Saccharimonadales bacterium]|nr:30S ribosomal protein S8 [Candidatus Saccharimonadales bacterium]